MWQEWEWSERYPEQHEILAYLEYVAQRFGLYRDIEFSTRVTAATFDEAASRWTVTTDTGRQFTAQFVISAVGALSVSNVPKFPGADTFAGDSYHTGLWPHEGVDFTGQRVAVIGTGASAVQAIPLIAQQAADLTVFQRTPNYILPARNGPVDPGVKRTRQGDYAGIWARVQSSNFGFELYLLDKGALESSDEEIERELMERWNQGGFGIWLGSYLDIFFSDEANAKVRKFLNERIREKVHDPETAELLTPKGYAFGCKRVPLDSGYYETFNLPRVHLVDVKTNPIAEITPAGLRLTDGTKCEFDAIVYATGFDAMTGPLNKIDIRGRDGRRLRDKWADGPRTYLGLMSAGYPNLFTITGPQSPSVLSNMPVSIEQHVEFIARIIGAVRDRGAQAIEPTSQAEDAWVAHNQEVAQASLFPTADTWYMGANIPGKPRVFMPYLGLVGPYRQKCDEIAAAGFEGFEFTGSTDKEGAPA
jgi:cyclohexanone monooxygenase